MDGDPGATQTPAILTETLYVIRELESITIQSITRAEFLESKVFIGY